jgi:hypothetical protein
MNILKMLAGRAGKTTFGVQGVNHSVVIESYAKTSHPRAEFTGQY